MKRVGFVLKVKPDRLEEYKQHHEQVWPEMREALRASGWHNYSLFVRNDGLLFGYVETPDGLAAAQARAWPHRGEHPLAGIHGPLLRSSPDNARPDEMFGELTDFHLD